MLQQRGVQLVSICESSSQTQLRFWNGNDETFLQAFYREPRVKSQERADTERTDKQVGIKPLSESRTQSMLKMSRDRFFLSS